MKITIAISLVLLAVLLISCNQKLKKKTKVSQTKEQTISAKEILGNPDYQAISYGGYRTKSRKNQPTIQQLKEDMRIMEAMGIKVLRTYNTHFAQAGNVLKAIRELKNEDASFEMYVMLGVWIDCEGAWTPHPNHEVEDAEANAAEMERAVSMAKEYSDIVKVIAVGNEAMVKWAASYFVQPNVILKWVNYLQNLKKEGELSKDLWITSSDNFASWGGGGEEYHVEDLTKLMHAVDYISVHTYPMHDTHYNPSFWGVWGDESDLNKAEQIAKAMDRSLNYAKEQYQSVVDYAKKLGVAKPVHIGETGWATVSSGFYGPNGSRATDEYKEALYYNAMRNWTNAEGISCFYFEAFDEPWKDAQNQQGSENHFGLITVNGQAKYTLWNLVDEGAFNGLRRDGQPITKTYNGDEEKLMRDVLIPPKK